MHKKSEIKDLTEKTKSDVSGLIRLKKEYSNKPNIAYLNINNLQKEIETICITVTISKKKWCITFAYRPPENDNKVMFSNELK